MSEWSERGTGLTAEISLPHAWAERWAVEPDRPQIHDPVAGWRSRGWLDATSRSVAGRLFQAGLRKGDRVIVSAAASAQLVAVHVACLRLGLIVVPVNLAYRRAELTHVVDDARPRAAVTDNEVWLEWFRELMPAGVCCGPDVDLVEGTPPSLDQVESSDAALIGYTSGTTGAPKGAVLDHGNLLAGAEALRRAWRWTADDRLVLTLPLFHMHGLGVGLHGTLLAGASAVLLPRFDPDMMLDAAARHEATLFFGVPTMYARLARSPRAGELAALRLCVSGSAPLSPELSEDLTRVSGQHVLERYGMTETVMLTSNPYDGARRPGTVGFPLPGVELRLDRTASDGEPLPTSGPAAGEVQVRGPNVFGSYWRRPEASAEAFTSDGWFRTGDIGELDGDGYLVLVGRAKELIISGGFNVYPREVEDALATHPAVADVAVAGTDDPDWGELVTAFVVPAPGADSEDLSVDALRAHLVDRLAPFKQPRAVDLVDELPRNAMGKVQRHLL